MRPRQSLPCLWLMTDERMGDALWCALDRLPRGSGVIFRHRATPAVERRRLYDAVRAVTRRRGLMLVLAGSPRDAIGWRADGAHGASPHVTRGRELIRTAPAHGPSDLRREVDAVFLSPVFPTRSHPGRAALGPVRFGLWRRRGRAAVIALGGMDGDRFRRLHAFGADGYAAIDAWIVEEPARTSRVSTRPLRT
jgi:thiamine-phosphate pyrophosphorylase